MPDNASTHVPAPVVAVASWLLPGSGYWLQRQWLRGTVIGGTILILYIGGLLIGGIRVIETPGYGDHGQPLIVVQTSQDEQRVTERTVESTGDQEPGTVGWVMLSHPFDELRNKPWNIPQILTGPIHIVACWGSVLASRPQPADSPWPVGARSHARTNEIGALYCAVAGMLNLLAMIDATSRAVHREEEP